MFTIVIIYLFELGEVGVRAEDAQHSEQVNWNEGKIAIITGAQRLRIDGTGKLVCICISYETSTTK